MYLKDIITSEVRVKILTELFSETDKNLYVRELTRRVGTEINAVRRELKRLSLAGIIRKEKRGNRLYYLLRNDYPIYPELMAMVAKETGIGGRILKNLNDLGKIKLAVLATAYLEGRVSEKNQLDLLFVGEVNLQLLDQLVKETVGETKRDINYTVLKEEEFEHLKSRRDIFILTFLINPKIIITGEASKYLEFK